MQSKGWKNLLFAILLTSSSANKCCIRVDAAWAANSEIKSLVSTQRTHQLIQKGEQKVINSELRQLDILELAYAEQTPSNLTLQEALTTQPNPVLSATPNAKPRYAQNENSSPSEIQPTNEAPQLETQPNDLPQSSPKPIEQLLDKPQIDYTERLERLRQVLQQKKQPTPESNSLPELGLRVQQRPLSQKPLEQLPPLATEQPIVKSKPIGFLQARIGYFHASNIFSSDVVPIEDGLMFYGLSLASAYFPVSSKTYLNGSIDGNLIRYADRSKYNYNQLRFNLGIYQQLSQRMYGEFSWSNQQLFYANSSDRFLGENSLRLSVGRRDPLTQKLMLDSFYEFSLNFAEPNNRDRVINFVWVSLNYYWQKPLQVGLDYQFNSSDFTQRQRDDNYHRLFAHLNYKVSNSSNINLQSGISFGDSTDSNIDFDGWFFSINYNLQLGRF
ncbi:hypothetical protein [Dendronalium sp. ChiSLP03b]|uniref:hypothetical protein n=1 Tax=Dendronalium sp. ChiSLP03b TaxID=3075381 RepID=UPI002AD1F29E|nr:hypothetical protein [Dendronalium sp. ChiSLP03b]MDZ8206399.1 hypothetical protein [Dendronalium sp. ChiSLP03b]